jgi:phosphatidylglycerol lysyltransferase
MKMQWSVERPAFAAAVRVARLASPLAGLVFFGLALWALYWSLREYHYRDMVEVFRALPASRVASALGLTAAGYLVLTGYDALGFRYAGRPVPLRPVALASFIANAFGNTVGNTLITGAAVRYWIYASYGLSATEITRAVLFCSLGFWLGFTLLGGLLFLIEPIAMPAALHLPLATTRPLGAVLLGALAAYGLLVATRRRPWKVGGWTLAVPSPVLTLGQLGVTALDLVLMASALYVLLPPAASLSYALFLSIFLLALVAGTVSQVPGGLGVFETVMLLLLGQAMAAPGVVAALLAFRAIYFLLPLLAAAAIVGLREARGRAIPFERLFQNVGQWITATVPQVLALAIFVAGAILLFSGAVPAARGRLVVLHRVLPLPIIELSHFLASLVGAALLVLARGVQRRLDAAYVLALALLGAGIVLSFAKGFDYEEAIVLAVIFAALAPCHRRFYRRSSLLAEPFTWDWIASVAMVLGGAVWLALFAFKRVEYSEELWWRFALHAEAPRALRAMVGAVGLAVIVAAAHLLRPARPRATRPGPADLERARPIVERSVWTYANLVFRGDKAVLFSESGNAFLMYGRMRRSWVAMGDPVGPENEARELAWSFRGLCDRYGGRPVFFEVRPENVPLYLDLGLSLTKLGEEARVELTRFALDLPAHAALRQPRARLLRKGCRFEILAPPEVPALLPAVARVSEAWLAEKATREKGFSNASFDVDYLARFPLAVVRSANEIIAFANLWRGAQGEELSIDLMRHVPDAPNGTMDYLFSELMLWGREQGYRWFNLGMAPLSGLVSGEAAPLWHRLGTLVYRHGEHFYNFRGVRRYKEKFGPVWTPRYLASPGGLALPATLIDVAALIAGSLSGIVLKR